MEVRPREPVGKGFAFFVLVSGIFWTVFVISLVYDNYAFGRGYESDGFFLLLIISMLLVGIGFVAYGIRKLQNLRTGELQ
jgi:uncharacterized membrane protein